MLRYYETDDEIKQSINAYYSHKHSVSLKVEDLFK